ncbi:MAG: hypothetical protein IT379_38615 [Deltaproteobacteria bacterium]|nr:hypothetical protein [Deltaproteobacteria bacterium]
MLRYYERRGWDTGGIEFLLPVYRYYRLMRDCAAHRAGLVGPALAEASKEQQWSGAIKLWSARTGDSTSPPLVELREGTRVVLGHRDAICGSSVLLRIASDMNRRALSNLDKEGVTYLAFRRALVGDPPELRVVGYRTPVAVLHDALSRRYRVADLNEAETIEILKSLDLWARCRDEFARLQGRGYFPS